MVQGEQKMTTQEISKRIEGVIINGKSYNVLSVEKMIKDAPSIDKTFVEERASLVEDATHYHVLDEKFSGATNLVYFLKETGETD